jgi:hypothetical protein
MGGPPRSAPVSKDDAVDRPVMSVSGPTLDASDPIALAEFYERLLGWPIVRREGPRQGNPSSDGWAMLRSPSGGQKIEVQWEPRYRPPVWPSTDGEQLMMMHLDIGVADLDSSAAWAIAQGASLAEHQPQPSVRVMLDPEGHPFCLFPDETLTAAFDESGDTAQPPLSARG